MYVLITYDVSGEGGSGLKRLRRVAKICARYGQRVQFSVFECLLDPAQYEALKHEIRQAIDESKDSVRFYNLGRRRQGRVQHIGAKRPYDPEGTLMV